MGYAIISVGGKQYRVSEGQKLLVDRLSQEAGKSFTPEVLLVGGDGEADLSPKGITVTARVVEHVLGEKIRIGKYRAKTGYRRHGGHRSRLSRIEIESIGKRSARTAKSKTAPEPKGEEEVKVPAVKAKRATGKTKEEE
jgi:large subunit ribosomal protein L21